MHLILPRTPYCRSLEHWDAVYLVSPLLCLHVSYQIIHNCKSLQNTLNVFIDVLWIYGDY
uniref:Uncharacterized protein n=1 Tax=Rhizophora mucronata TaxID=61149 RepID=A0A2P2J044_RHIMU